MPTTTPTLADQIDHAEFCTPRPGEQEPRTEVYRTARTDEYGRTTSRPQIARCMECAEQVIEG